MKKTFIVFLILMVMGCGQQTKTNELPQTQNQIEQKNEGEDYDPPLQEEPTKAERSLNAVEDKVADVIADTATFVVSHWIPVTTTAVSIVLLAITYHFDLHSSVWTGIKKLGSSKPKNGIFWLGRQIKKSFVYLMDKCKKKTDDAKSDVIIPSRAKNEEPPKKDELPKVEDTPPFIPSTPPSGAPKPPPAHPKVRAKSKKGSQTSSKYSTSSSDDEKTKDIEDTEEKKKKNIIAFRQSTKFLYTPSSDVTTKQTVMPERKQFCFYASPGSRKKIENTWYYRPVMRVLNSMPEKRDLILSRPSVESPFAGAMETLYKDSDQEDHQDDYLQ